MNNDLISREALKRAITLNRNIERNAACDVLDIIDNAPTVEPFEPDYVGSERLKARQRGYEDGYHNGMEIGKTLNPKIKQGEWIFEKAGNDCTDGYICSECGVSFHTKVPYFSEFNFCPNCGADMRGEDHD